MQSVIMAEFDSLAQAINSDEFENFKAQHSLCGNINLIPVLATHMTTIKCTECKFTKQMMSTKRIARINTEFYTICDAINTALHRTEPQHKNCGCDICSLQWSASHIQDTRGTHYRLVPFDCNKVSVIYIIHCKLCNTN